MELTATRHTGHCSSSGRAVPCPLPCELIELVHVQGRILVLETKPQQQKLHIVCEKETRGAVYTISGFQVCSIPTQLHALLGTHLLPTPGTPH